MTRATAAEKVRKLLATAARAKGNEARVAADLARKLKAKYELTAEEVAPLAREIETVVDEADEDWRVSLAFAVATSRECKAFVKPDKSIALRGQQLAHDSAVALYTDAACTVEEGCTASTPAIRGQLANALVGSIWRERFCSGFVDALAQRLLRGAPAQPQQAPAPPAEQKKDPTVEKGLALVDELQRRMPVEMAAATASEIFDVAYLRGFARGETLDCGVWPPPRPADLDLKALPPYIAPPPSTPPAPAAERPAKPSRRADGRWDLLEID